MDWEQFETQLKQDQSAVEAALHARFQDSARYAVDKMEELGLVDDEKFARAKARYLFETKKEP